MTKPVNPILMMTAILLVAAMAFVVGVSGLAERQRLLDQGIKTNGLVVGVDLAVRGIRSVEARFTTIEGRTVVGHDIHKSQWFNANTIGDQVTLYYESQEPEKILIDRGLWIWSNPAFLLAGGALFCGLAAVVYRRSTVEPT